MTRRALSSMLVFAVLLVVAPRLWSASEARVRGTVANTAGAPIAAAAITLTCVEREGLIKEVETGEDGKFSTVLIDATKRYTLAVFADGYLPHEQVIKVPVGSTDSSFEITLLTPEEQQQQVQAAVKEQPGYREFEVGRQLLEQGKLDAAAAQFRAAVAQVPELRNGWMGLAKIAYQQQQWQQALDHASTCLELDGSASDCLAVAANASLELGDEAGHQAFLTRYQALNPDDPSTLFNRAAEHLNLMDDSKARPLLEQCLAADSGFPPCLYEYGMLLLRSGDMAGAKEKLQRYLEVDPDGENAAAATDTLQYL